MRRLLFSLFCLSLCLAALFYTRIQFWDVRVKRSPSSIQPTETPFPVMRNSVTLNDGVYTYHLNFTKFQSHFPFLQSYQCSVNITPSFKPQIEATKPILVFAIKSHPTSGQRRQALRQTWAQERELNGYRVKPIFLMGQTEVPGQMNLVKVESEHFGDILQWDFSEGHHNLSLKERCLLEWLHYNLRNVSFIFKGDDDEYVNPDAVVQYVKEHGSSPRTLHGQLRPHSGVMRTTKYAISEDLIPYNIYPHFLSGGGFMYPGQSVKILFEVSQKIPVFPLDDVYIGFLVLAGNLTYRHDNRFEVYGLRFDPCKYQRALVVHGVGPEELVQAWKEVQNTKCKDGKVVAR